MLLASPRGFEPPTSGLGNRCSIRLSYGDVAADIAPTLANVCPFQVRPRHGACRNNAAGSNNAASNNGCATQCQASAPITTPPR
jgi:hypothetical protein